MWSFKAARVMCPVTDQWLRSTLYPAIVEALRILKAHSSDAIIVGLIRELPQYIAAAEEVVIQNKEQKVE